MIFVVSIDGDFSPLQVEKLKHEILNLRGVVSVEWQESRPTMRPADGCQHQWFPPSTKCVHCGQELNVV